MVIVSTKPYTYLLEPLWLINLLFHNILGAPFYSNSISPNWSYNSPDYKNNRVYSFGYEIEDLERDNIQFRTEKRFLNGTVVGSYGYVELNGNVHMVHYVADENGYRAHVEDSYKNLDKASHTFSQEMTEAIKSLHFYKKQIQDQRLRPFDELSENEKIEYILSKNGYNNEIQLNEKVSSKSNNNYFDDNYDYAFIV